MRSVLQITDRRAFGAHVGGAFDADNDKGHGEFVLEIEDRCRYRFDAFYRVVAGDGGDAFALYVSEQGVGVVEGVDAGRGAAAGQFLEDLLFHLLARQPRSCWPGRSRRTIR